MSNASVVQHIITDSKTFRRFFKDKGPFDFALTCQGYPPILLDDEQWLFGEDPAALIRALIGFDRRKMTLKKTEYNKAKKKVLRPDALSPWQITPFVEEWENLDCDLFLPGGHLTLAFFNRAGLDPDSAGPDDVLAAFFTCLERELPRLGYLLLSNNPKDSWVTDLAGYLKEWEEDEADAGLV